MIYIISPQIPCVSLKLKILGEILGRVYLGFLQYCVLWQNTHLQKVALNEKGMLSGN